MRKGGGKQKGAQFEREVCVMLSKWLTNGKEEDVFWRSAMSGGRATVAHKKGVSLGAQAGDVSCIKSVGMHFIAQFAPECKFYANLDWQGLVSGKGKIINFWNEIGTQAGRYGKYPFLIARQNRMPAFVCLNYYGMAKLGLTWSAAAVISTRHDMFVFESEHFFKECKPYVNQMDTGKKIRHRLNPT